MDWVSTEFVKVAGPVAVVAITISITAMRLIYKLASNHLDHTNEELASLRKEVRDGFDKIDVGLNNAVLAFLAAAQNWTKDEPKP